MKTIAYIFLLSLCLFATPLIAQKHAQADADNAFSQGDYDKAMNLYRKAYEYISNQHNMKGTMKIKASIIFQIAECYRMKGDFQREIEEYSKALKAKYDDSIAAKRYIEEAKEHLPKYDSTGNHFSNQMKIQGDSAEMKK
jgi:tetratricopeptide (TPR) repeat protein